MGLGNLGAEAVEVGRAANRVFAVVFNTHEALARKGLGDGLTDAEETEFAQAIERAIAGDETEPSPEAIRRAEKTIFASFGEKTVKELAAMIDEAGRQ